MKASSRPREPVRSAIRIFSEGEKRELAGQAFRNLVLDMADFSSADLQGAIFDTVSLRACDFREADLRGTMFLRCDLRESNFLQVAMADNRFDQSWFGGVSGLTVEQTQYVFSRGGLFVAWGTCPTADLVHR